jgi:uncharacterized protein
VTVPTAVPADAPAEDLAVPGIAAGLGLPGIIDVHVHLLPPRLQARIWAHFDAAGPLIARPWPIRYRWAVPDLISHLRRMHVRAFSTMPYAHKPDVAAALNEWSLSLAAAHPDVLATLTFFPEPDAATYVERALAAGAQVGKLHLQVGDVDPREPLLDPVWGLLAEAGVPVVVHAGSGPVPGRFTGVGPIAAVLDRHPRLVAVIAHLGAPETSEFLDLMDRRENLYLDTTMSFTDFMDQIRPVSPQELARLADHGDRVLFGSDLPSIPHSYAHAVRSLLDLGMSREWLRAVLWDNAARLLGGPFASPADTPTG